MFAVADLNWLIGTLAVVVWVIVQLAAARGTRKPPPAAPQRLPRPPAPPPPGPAGEPVNPQDEIREFLQSVLGTESAGEQAEEESPAFVLSREVRLPPPPPARRPARRHAESAPTIAAVAPPAEPGHPQAAFPRPAPQHAAAEPALARAREFRAMFRQKPTLRSMILASEILGPPLALRPPSVLLGTVPTRRLPGQPLL